ncbi:28410_t:CDS:1, partial [Gigaspora margarita]
MNYACANAILDADIKAGMLIKKLNYMCNRMKISDENSEIIMMAKNKLDEYKKKFRLSSYRKPSKKNSDTGTYDGNNNGVIQVVLVTKMEPK